MSKLKYTKTLLYFSLTFILSKWVQVCEDVGGNVPFKLQSLQLIFHLSLSLLFRSNRGKIIRSREVHGSKGHLGHVAVFMNFCVLER